MSRLVAAIVLLPLLATPAPSAAQDAEPWFEELATFSIIARDPATGQLGEAMTSKALAGGNRAVTAKGGVAVIAHQQSANPMYGRIGMELIQMGLSPQEALDYMLRADEARDSRQVAIIDAQGRTAAWTSGGASAGEPGAWRGHRCGTDYCAQGNSLTGPEVVRAVAEAFEGARGTLAERMVAALEAGQAAGGDARGKQTALLLVVRPLSGSNPTHDRVVDFRVDDDPEPLVELRRLMRLNDAGGLIARGNVRLREGDAAGALALFLEARDLAPDNDNVWVALGGGYLAAGRRDEAFAALRRAVEINPSNRARLGRNAALAALHADPEFLRLTGS